MEQGANPVSTGNTLAKTVTLEVTPKQVETVAVASRIGRLSVVVRAADVTSEPALQPGDKTVPTWASDVSPALGVGTPQTGVSVRLFLGSADGKEIKF
jgi:pilus assembly protein CpaB